MNFEEMLGIDLNNNQLYHLLKINNLQDIQYLKSLIDFKSFETLKVGSFLRKIFNSESLFSTYSVDSTEVKSWGNHRLISFSGATNDFKDYYYILSNDFIQNKRIQTNFFTYFDNTLQFHKVITVFEEHETHHSRSDTDVFEVNRNVIDPDNIIKISTPSVIIIPRLTKVDRTKFKDYTLVPLTSFIRDNSVDGIRVESNNRGGFIGGLAGDILTRV